MQFCLYIVPMKSHFLRDKLNSILILFSALFFQDCPREGPVDSHYVKNSEKTNKCISGCSNTSKMNNNISLMSIISCVTPFSEKKIPKTNLKTSLNFFSLLWNFKNIVSPAGVRSGCQQNKKANVTVTCVYPQKLRMKDQMESYDDDSETKKKELSTFFQLSHGNSIVVNELVKLDTNNYHTFFLMGIFFGGKMTKTHFRPTSSQMSAFNFWHF